jgi:hypothetical protein
LSSECARDAHDKGELLKVTPSDVLPDFLLTNWKLRNERFGKFLEFKRMKPKLVGWKIKERLGSSLIFQTRALGTLGNAEGKESNILVWCNLEMQLDQCSSKD